MTLFDSVFAVVVGEEGGYTANPADPGNWTGGRVNAGICNGTKYGISAASYPHLSIADLTLDDAKIIYKRDYWDRVRIDELPSSFALIVFDATINSGANHAIRWLQLAVRVKADGKFGPITLAAVKESANNSSAVLAEYQAQRLTYLASLATWKTFGLGWTRRICLLPFDAQRIAGSMV